MADVMKRGRTRRAMSEINVVPYIDVMLVLLVIFMIIAPQIQRDTKVNYAKTTKVPPPTGASGKINRILITIDKEGNNYINIDGKNYGKQSPGKLGAQVNTAVTSNKALEIELHADKDTEYVNILNTIGVLKTAGATNVHLVTEPKADEN